MNSLTTSEAGNPAKKAYIEGLKKYKNGDFAGAYKSFSTAIDLGIEDFEILYYRGMSALKSEDFEKSGQDFEVLVRHSPDNPEYRFRRGYIRYKNRDLLGSAEDFERVTEDSEIFSMKWHYLSVIFYKTGKFKEALNAIEKALGFFPTIPKIWFNAGVIMNEADLSDRAELAFTTAARLEPRLTSAKREIIE